MSDTKSFMYVFVTLTDIDLIVLIDQPFFYQCINFLSPGVP